MEVPQVQVAELMVQACPGAKSLFFARMCSEGCSFNSGSLRVWGWRRVRVTSPSCSQPSATIHNHLNGIPKAIPFGEGFGGGLGWQHEVPVSQEM